MFRLPLCPWITAISLDYSHILGLLKLSGSSICAFLFSVLASNVLESRCFIFVFFLFIMVTYVLMLAQWFMSFVEGTRESNFILSRTQVCWTVVFLLISHIGLLTNTF